MKDFLRKCYQVAGIIGANARLYENRITAMQEILEDEDCFADEDWMLLTKWAIGVLDNDSVEKQMVTLEEMFCKTDPEYSNENVEELHILVGFLLYQYCEATENLLLPSVVICGHAVGWRLKCQPLYEKFLAFTEEARLNLRRLNKESFPNHADMRTSFQSLKKKAETATDTKSQADESVAADATQRAPTANDLAALEDCLRWISRQNEALAFALSVQREESDILWWTLAEWSENRQCLYRDMTREEAALFSAYELGGIVCLPLGPYASKQILMKMISLGKADKNQERVSAATLIDRLSGDILPFFKDCQVTGLQPLLSALNAKQKATQKGKSDEWRPYYEVSCEKDLDTSQLTAFDFGQQLYLEIELGRQLYMERGSE